MTHHMPERAARYGNFVRRGWVPPVDGRHYQWQSYRRIFTMEGQGR